MTNDAVLRDVCELIIDCPHSTPKWTKSGVLVLRSNNIRSGRLDLSTQSFTDEANYKHRSRRAELRAGDLVITREAPMGEVCIVPTGLRCCLGQRMVLLRPDHSKCDGRYLLYALQSPRVQNQIAWSEGTGSTVSNLRIPHLAALRVAMPTLPEQRAIAAVLGALDDKIEQNQRTSQALEALARATFKAWFVDFEPVKAKAAGATSFPGMPPALFAALTDRLINSEGGLMPKGWQVGTVGDIATISKKQIDPRRYPDETFEHFSIPAHDAGRYPIVELGGSIKSQKFEVVPESVLFSKLNPRIPRLWMPVLGNSRRQIASTEFLVFIPRPAWGRAFLYFLFQQNDFRDKLAQAASGTSNSHQRVRPSDLLSHGLILPPSMAHEAFTSIISPMVSAEEALHAESAKLAALRDYLLPRLMSGQVRVASSQQK